MKYRIHIKADTEEAVKEELREAALIITGLRDATEKCKKGYQSQLVRDKENWERRADEFINKHKVFYQG